MGKKAQITIFAILAILIIAVIALLFTLYQDPLRRIISGQQQDTTQILEQCVNEHVEEVIDILIGNVGSIENPSLTKTWHGEEIPYLCYTGLYYARCTPQAPVLIRFLKEEITRYLDPRIDKCFQDMKLGLEEQAYEIKLGSSQEIEVDLLPGRVRTLITRDFSQTKSDETREFNSFEANFQTPLYFLDIITHEIVAQEATICNSDYVQIMRAHPDIEITKINTGDDVKIQTIKDKDSEKGWTFAIRSCVLATPG